VPSFCANACKLVGGKFADFFAAPVFTLAAETAALAKESASFPIGESALPRTGEFGGAADGWLAAVFV
jgi:hypothetical protein